MKIAVISDIHGNLPALQHVTADLEGWQPDHVVVNGDVVNRGPCSLACLEFVRHKQEKSGWEVLRGNHEEYVLACINDDFPKPDDGEKFELVRFAYWTYLQLNGEIDDLATWPDEFSWQAEDGSVLRVMHGSRKGNRHGIYAKMSDEEVRERMPEETAVFVTAHTHEPLIRTVDQTTVVNIGSVGSPFDGDTRPSYGRFEWTPESGWQCDVIRVPFDQALIEKDYVQSGFLQDAGPFAQLMLIELRRAGGLFYRWGQRYHERVENGELSVEESVRELLNDEDLRPFLGAPGWEL